MIWFLLRNLTKSTCLIRMSYPYEYELYKRVDESPKKEKYVVLSKFVKRPSGEEINDAFEGKTRYSKIGFI